jgi:hypothetical protein
MQLNFVRWNFQRNYYSFIPPSLSLWRLNQIPGHGLFTYEASRSHSLDTLHSLGLLWTSDQPVAETIHNTHNKHPRRRRDSQRAIERSHTHALLNAGPLRIGYSSVLTELEEMYQCTRTEHKPPHNRQVSKSLGKERVSCHHSVAKSERGGSYNVEEFVDQS